MSTSAGSDRSVTVVATVATEEGEQVEVTYCDQRVVGSGAFGVVCVATLQKTGERVAIKKVLQDKRFKNRELEILLKLDHQNVVKLKYYFYSAGSKKDDVYLNLLLEFVPETVYRVTRHFNKQRSHVPIFYVKLYMYQLFRGLAYIHSLGVTHRDIKPQNLLVDPETGVLKVCDFGSAKYIVAGEANVAYICSRYYRAPELIFGAKNYTNAIDIWSAGAVMAELVNGQPLFPGESGVDQLVQVVKVLGTPTKEQIRSLNDNYLDFKFPEIPAQPWEKIFRAQTPPEVINLARAIFEYKPTSRPSAQIASAHRFFADLAKPDARMPNGKPLPPLEMNEDYDDST